MENKRLYTYSAISLVISSALLYLIFKLNKVGNQSESDKPSNSFSKDTFKDYVITKPSDKTSVNVVLIFGGMAYANPEWMMQQIPKETLLKSLIFIAPYTSKLSVVKNDLDSYLKSKNLKQKSLSVIGFSAGGYNAQASYSKDLRFFGLIDPSTKSDYLNIDFGNSANMTYNNDNWNVYPNIKSLQPKIANNILKGGGNVEVVSMSHINIPKYFFNSHSDKI
jgi:hypothetical protein